MIQGEKDPKIKKEKEIITSGQNLIEKKQQISLHH
jgi:hypothetical protein